MNIWIKIKKFDWTQLRHLGFIGLFGFLSKPELKLFFLFYLIGFADYFKKTAKGEDLKGKDLTQYYRTFFLCQFNPFTLSKAIEQAFGQIIIILKNISGYPNKDNYKSKIFYRLPFREEWLIV